MVEVSGTDIVYLACGATDMRKAIDGLSVEQPKAHKPVNARLYKG